MNTIWLKLAAAAVAVVVVIVIIGKFTSPKQNASPQAQPERFDTVYDAFARDDKKFGVKFDGRDEGEANSTTTKSTPQQPETAAQTPPAQQAQTQPQPQPHFEKLLIEDEVEAQKLHAMALEERKRSRLPMMTPKMMVDYCREIIRRWPKSEYAYKAKLLLADVPDRFKEMYKIAPQEMDVSSFYK